MRVLVSDSYNIAWFTLADFVVRGEKERALSMHRLLMHSVQDVAIAQQLEGDILLAFGDEVAFDKYYSAAMLYKQSGKYQQAISVCQQVCLLRQDERILHVLFEIYNTLNNKLATLETFSRLAKVYILQHNTELLQKTFHDNFSHSSQEMQTLLTARLVRALLLYDNAHANIAQYMQQALDLFKTSLESCQLDQTDLQKFLSEVKALNFDEYKKAEKYLKNNL
ncbi:MAG TPA: hypothetical protein VLG50_01290 [Candidatus Saccharimonadales bacterium]|nr:hypothetical protein [Candidatus Saccharimonadales bacterium]